MDSVSKHGIIAYPKSDGRIEIPQSLVKQLGWKSNIININFIDGEIVIGENTIEEWYNSYKIKTSDHRIRIPFNVLRKAKCEGIELRIFSNGKYIIVTKTVTKDKSIVELNQPDLVLSSIEHPTVFKIVGGPFTFPAFWSEEIVVAKEGNEEKDVEQLYIIPGIHIKKNDFKYGFLLVSEIVLLHIRNKIIEYKKDFPEIILFYDSFTKGGFRVYINPPTIIDESHIIKAQSLCKEPIAFIKKRFRMERDTDIIKKLPVLSAQTLRIL